MPQHVHYKRPRKINAVSAALVLFLVVGGYVGVKYFNLYFLRQEAYRVLDEYSSKIGARPGKYVDNERATESLRMRMHADLRRIGVNDPASETWIEFEGHEARLGVIYSAWIDWPADVLPRQEKTYEVEYVLPLRRP